MSTTNRDFFVEVHDSNYPSVKIRVPYDSAKSLEEQVRAAKEAIAKANANPEHVRDEIADLVDRLSYTNQNLVNTTKELSSTDWEAKAKQWVESSKAGLQRRIEQDTGTTEKLQRQLDKQRALLAEVEKA